MPPHGVRKATNLAHFCSDCCQDNVAKLLKLNESTVARVCRFFSWDTTCGPQKLNPIQAGAVILTQHSLVVDIHDEDRQVLASPQRDGRSECNAGYFAAIFLKVCV